jgi:hypothetical protein
MRSQSDSGPGCTSASPAAPLGEPLVDERPLFFAMDRGVVHDKNKRPPAGLPSPCLQQRRDGGFQQLEEVCELHTALPFFRRRDVVRPETLLRAHAEGVDLRLEARSAGADGRFVSPRTQNFLSCTNEPR